MELTIQVLNTLELAAVISFIIFVFAKRNEIFEKVMRVVISSLALVFHIIEVLIKIHLTMKYTSKIVAIILSLLVLILSIQDLKKSK